MRLEPSAVWLARSAVRWHGPTVRLVEAAMRLVAVRVPESESAVRTNVRSALRGCAGAPEKWRSNAGLIPRAEPIRTGKNKLAKTEKDPLRKAAGTRKNRRAVTGELKTAGDRGQGVGWWFG